MSDPRLMIPGPVEADDDVLAAIGRQTMPHYGPQFMTLFRETTTLLKRLFETKGDALMVPGPGTAALDGAISSLVPRGQSICTLDNGFFGMRMTQIIEANDIQPYVVSAPWGQPIDPDEVRRRLGEWMPQAERAGQPIRALAIVHHETATGVLNPLEALVTAGREFGLAIIVDAVASLGGVRIPVDAWGIDVCVSVPNKCIGAPPGLALAAISPRAWEMAKANTTPHGWYLNLNTWAWYIENWGDWHPFPTTMPTNNVAAVNQALKGIFAQGVEAHLASFARAAARVREGMAEMGFTLFPDPAYAAPVISALNVRDGVDIGDMLRYLLREHALMVSGGLAELKGKIFRVGHMGKGKDPAVVEALLEATRSYLQEHALA